MEFNCIKTGSSGNSYFLKASNGEILLLEAGIKWSDVRKAINFKISDVCGLIFSHAHLDHAKYTKQYIDAGIDCYSSLECFNDLGYPGHHKAIGIKPMVKRKIGEFTIMPFNLEHGVVNYGYLIYHSECGLVPFITDTHYVKQKFSGLSNIIIEANYSEDLLDEAMINQSTNLAVRNRVIHAHMEIETTKQWLLKHDLSKVRKIVLIHLSSAHADPDMFKSTIEAATGVPTYIASPGLSIDFNSSPF